MLIKVLEIDITKANVAYRTGETLDISELSKSTQQFLNKNLGPLSDKQYDSMVEKLKELKPDSEIFTSGVIEKTKELVSKDREVKLDHPMYSLDKEKSVDEIKKWAKNKGLSPDVFLVVTAKYDGISVLRNELTTKTASRGDGINGEDITEHYKSLNTLTTKKTSKEFYTIGELIIPRNLFEERKNTFVRDNGKIYKNPRNMVAGLKNSDDVSPYWSVVDHVRYGVADEKYKYNKTEQFELIEKETGYKVPHEIFKLSEITEEKLDELYYKWGEVYEIDGLVIEIEDKNIRKQLGRETNNNPAYTRAYKSDWSTPTSTVVLLNVWDVSKEGYVKPVVNVQPFDTEGVTVSKVTGYNAKFIKQNQIGKGSVVEIIRSGSVIPKIVGISKATQADIPTHCPSCDTELIWNENKVEIVCTNSKCETKNIKKIAFFFSALDIEDFGEPTVRKFYHNGYDTVGKILNMTISDIAVMEGMGNSSANNILSQFDKVKNAKFEKLGHASGCFENLGSRKLKMVVDGIGGIKGFENFKERFSEYGITEKLVYELENIKGVAETTALAFMRGLTCFEYFCDEMGVEVKKIEEKSESTISFKDRVFVFSGVRDKELQQFIIDNDGDVKTSVSRNTTDILVKDINSTSSKVVKARELGVNILNIEEFKNSI